MYRRMSSCFDRSRVHRSRPPPPTRLQKRAEMQAFMVQVPPGVSPGQQFQAIVGQQKVAIVVPAGVVPAKGFRFRCRLKCCTTTASSPPRAAAPSQPINASKDGDGTKGSRRSQGQERSTRSTGTQTEERLHAINNKHELAQQPKAAPASRGAGAQRVNVNHPDEIFVMVAQHGIVVADLAPPKGGELRRVLHP